MELRIQSSFGELCWGGPDGVDSKENERRKIGHMKRTFPMSFVIKFGYFMIG